YRVSLLVRLLIFFYGSVHARVLHSFPTRRSSDLDQFDAVLDDMPVDASKSGMLGTRRLVEIVAARAATGRLGFFTVDPVMIATSGHRLLEADAVDAVRTHLLPVADLITPNLPEAALLLGDDEPEAQTPEQMRDQARRLLDQGPGAV